MHLNTLFPVVIGVWATACGTSASRLSQSTPFQAVVDTRMLTKVGIVPRLRVGDSFIWGYYPGAGTKPRMYEGYIKLPDRDGKPTLGLLTLFPDETPSGEWVLHDGIGFDYDEVVAAFASPESTRFPQEQMFGWNAERQNWFRSTSRPNTSANTEKFNYRSAVIRTGNLAWRTKFGCYDGQDVTAVNGNTGSCDRGEIVFQQIPRDLPPYVFLPYYSLTTKVTLFKIFNEGSTDPDAHVAMRIVYANDRHGERILGDSESLSSYIASFKTKIQDTLVRESE
jgi:hypothetical protein